MPHLLYLGHVWPEPRSSAAGRRTLSVLGAFHEAGWEVSFASAAEAGERAEGLDNVTHRRQPVLLNDERFDRFLADISPDVVVFDRFMTEEQFGWRVERTLPSALRVLDSIDLHCLRRVRQSMAGSPADRDAYRLSPEADDEELAQRLLASDDAKREVASILRSDLTLVVSPFEIDLLRRIFAVDDELLHLLPLMAETGRRTDAAFDVREGFATIGNFMHAPNHDAVAWLHAELWPRLRERLPDAELNVYGSYTPEAVKRLDDPTRGFRVRGWAEDAVASLARARVCLAPLRFGAGQKGKILDALAAGTPVVATPIAAEGMQRPGSQWCGAVAADVESFVDAAVRLYEEPEAWRRAQTAGREMLAKDHDARVLAPALLDRIVSSMERREERRTKNFVGAMLRHHHHRSTEFMARWIEAKNRRRDDAD